MGKSMSTTQNEANIQEVLRLLSATPGEIERLGDGLSLDRLTKPLGSGERSFIEDLAHLTNTEARAAEAIYLALLVDEPRILNIHPERQWGKLVRYDLMPFPDLLAYFRFRRTILLRILEPLSDAKWARRVREEGKQRQESVYWKARALALHEAEHLLDLAAKLAGR